MKYDVDVYILKGLVKVEGMEAKNKEEAERKATKKVENAEVGYHGNYPNPGKRYLAIVAEKIN